MFDQIMQMLAISLPNASYVMSIVSTYVLRTCHSFATMTWQFMSAEMTFHEWFYRDVLSTWYPHFWLHLHDGKARIFKGRTEVLILQERSLSIFTYVIGNMNRMAVRFSGVKVECRRYLLTVNCSEVTHLKFMKFLEDIPSQNDSLQRMFRLWWAYKKSVLHIMTSIWQCV
jgi:hypothetical protein